MSGSDTQSLVRAGKLSRRVRAMAGFLLMTALYISAVICIRNTSMPRDHSPYFYNNEYHAISNSAIHFGHQLPLYTKTDAEQGAKVILKNSGDQVSIISQNYFHPIFAEGTEEGQYQLVNKIYPRRITRNFTFSNGKTYVSIDIRKNHSWWKKLLGRSPKAEYHVRIESLESELFGEQIARIKDEFTFRGPWLKEGMSLYDVMFEQEIIQAPGAEAMQVLQDMMQQIGQSYLIADRTGEEGFYFFPERAFLDNGFQLSIDGKEVAAQTSNEHQIGKGQYFYMGFHNHKEKMKVEDDPAEQAGKTMLVFDHSPKYWLSVPSEQQVLNNKSLAFLTNDFDRVIDGKGKEGFYFNNFGLMTDALFEARMNYLIGKPTDPLMFSVQDLRTIDGKNISSPEFVLQTSDPSVQFAFEIRDFSDNGFSFDKMLIYAALVYIGFVLVLVFFPGKDLGRIEPVIYTTIFGLFVVRMLMYWRLATFPPLEHISKYELENTILNFDFNFLVKLPVPLTLIWLYLFLAVIILFRTMGSRIKSAYQRLVDTRILSGKRSVYMAYAMLMGGLLVFNFVNNKLLGIEMLTRVLGIIAPVMLYILFSSISNKKFVLNEKWVNPKDKGWIREIKAYFYYFINNPAFIISMITLLYLAFTDRGFAILFVLFLILKNILFNFLKKSYNSTQYTFGQMLFKPNNYWIYGITALIIYFVILSVKSFFYYVLLYYMWLVGVMLVFILAFCYFFLREKKRLLQVVAGILGVYIIIVAIPFTRNALDHAVTNQIRHVQYRISIINQPISDLLMQNEYTSFSTRKIIETAENQWFINSYISKEYDNDRTLNLRPYNRVGVNYNTQTRDVVLARFVIGEMGNTTMYLLLTLCFFPLLIYLLSFKFTEDDGRYYKINVQSYPGIVPLILFFTISLFVWLTSTNRFVFFGQDFPFLSLTSKTSMVLPLLLLGYTLIQQPKAKSSEVVNLQSGFVRYALFAGLIAFFALITVTPNTLSTKNFSVVVDKTQRKIDQELNAILATVQDSISVKNPNYSYSQMITALKSDPSFEEFYQESIDDPYTRSIVQRLVAQPYSAFQVNSPLYIQYDGYRYSALYNQHFYLELTPVENEEVWHGSIAQIPRAGNAAVTLVYDNVPVDIAIPSYQVLNEQQVQLAFLPQSWLANAAGNAVLLDMNKPAVAAQLFIFKDVKQLFEQRSTSFAVSINGNDLAAIEQDGRRSTLQFEDQSNIYAFNKWINGRYRILFPQRPRNMWIHHFAHSIKDIYNQQDQYRGRYNISLDFNLNKRIEHVIYAATAKHKSDNKYKFAVIAADGNGNIHLMQDFVSNRKVIDPNDNYTIYKLKQEQFFFSNIRNERDQWGESNLLNMMLGPGSSIKPLIAGVVSSQVNAGWEDLVLNGVGSDQQYYAGFRMVKPWIKEVQDGGRFDLAAYIQKSSNFYQSVMMFLGSYPKDAFVKDGSASLANVLVSNPGANNSFPSLTFNGTAMYLPNYNKGKNNWPRTNFQEERKTTYFGNENSLLANGLEVNANLITKEKNKEILQAGAYDRINMIDSASYARLRATGTANFLWSMPEESTFLQSLRAPKEIHQNVVIGLKTATLGGYPYQLSTFKMLEMYGSLITQNRSYRLHLDERKLPYTPWYIDSTWSGQQQYKQFLASYIIRGMANVVTSGTARNLARPDAGYFYYAKTGTINEQGSGAKSSKRLVVAISDKDLTHPENIGNAKVYLFYFMADRTGSSIDWSLVNQIIAEAMKSPGFKNYFNS